MSSLEITSLITAMANFIACNTDDNDSVGLLGAIFTQLGDTLTTISLQHAICEKNQLEDNIKGNQ